MTVALTSLAGPSSASAPAVVSGSPGLGNPVAVVLAQGWTYTGVQFYRTVGTANPVAITGATSSPYTQVSADIPAIGAADIVITALLTGLTYSPPTGVTNSSAATAAAVVSAPVVNGVPQVNVPLSITAGVFSGANPAATIARVIYANGVPVASGNASTTYTPVAGDFGAVFTVVDTATNSAGAVPNMSAASAACIAAAVSTADISHAFKGAPLNGVTFN